MIVHVDVDVKLFYVPYLEDNFIFIMFYKRIL
jgi:hypothetical protein